MDDLSALLSNHRDKKCLVCVGVGGFVLGSPCVYLWRVLGGEFMPACSYRKRHYTEASFPRVFYCLLITHVWSNNIALYLNIMQVTIRRTHKAKPC